MAGGFRNDKRQLGNSGTVEEEENSRQAGCLDFEKIQRVLAELQNWRNPFILINGRQIYKFTREKIQIFQILNLTTVSNVKTFLNGKLASFETKVKGSRKREMGEYLATSRLERAPPGGWQRYFEDVPEDQMTGR